MGTNGLPTAAQDIGTFVEQLSGSADGLDKDDLVGLAKIHTLCEALAGATGSDGGPPSQKLHHDAASLARALEALILGEAENPDAIAASIVQMLTALAVPDVLLDNAANVIMEPPLTASTEPAADEVAAKLAGLFDDEDASPGAAASFPRTDQSEAAAASGNVEQPREGQAPGNAAASLAQSSAQREACGESRFESTPLRIAQGEEDFVKGFVEEAAEHIEAVEAAILDVEQVPDDKNRIDSLFRPFHTIKGAAGFLNLRDIISLTHEVETLLDQARKGHRAITSGLIDLIFEVVDVLRAQLAAISNYLGDPTGTDVPQPPIGAIIARLRDAVAGHVEPAVGKSTREDSVDNFAKDSPDDVRAPNDASDSASANRKEDLKKAAGQSPDHSDLSAVRQPAQAEDPANSKPPAGAAGGSSTAGEQSVRIDTAKLDALVDMVGELVIAQAQICANPQVPADPRLSQDVNRATKIVRDVQDVAMAMRMIPIGGTFQKMARLVRDVARKVNKTVELTISGEETELDKNVIQQISDPLVHMVRNAVDHGIEPAEQRIQSGKPSAGHVHLAAAHQGGNIVIQVRDDGKGLDPAALVKKAVEKGVLHPQEILTDEQAFQLIFAPGFSMAKEVTGISGRGVGMDVVRRNIEQLRGKVEISSQLGEGTTFSIRLPLTLAIIDGMIVRVGTERFIIQTICVEQAMRPKPEQITSVQQKGAVLNVRGRLIPLVQLGHLFGLTGPVDPCETIVVIAQYPGGEIGLVVDELVGQQQVVIKSLGPRFSALRGVSGAAILGDGRVGLILEMSGVVAARAGRDNGRPQRASERLSTPRASESRRGDPSETAEAVADAVLPK